MIVLEPVTRQNLDAFRTIRLCALREDPAAFGSTYEREVRFTDAEWAARLERWDGRAGLGLLAMRGEVACALAGVLLEREDAPAAELVSMWVAPECRRSGVARRLVEELAIWAAARNAGVLRLMVTSSNAGAIAFYERAGFVRTGRTEPYPNDLSLVEYEMARLLFA